MYDDREGNPEGDWDVAVGCGCVVSAALTTIES
jgi:hypothetical protein